MSLQSLQSSRASRVTAPGALRIILTGILAVSDDFDRIRLLILNEKKDNTYNNSWRILKSAVPKLHVNYQTPYEEHSQNDDVQCTVLIVLPEHRKKYWLGVAKDLRGQWVAVEVTVRPFTIPGSQGASLDLSMLSPVK